jgi:cell division protease FtsH
MITVYGMSEYIPNISLTEQNSTNFLGYRPPASPHSQKLEQLIDDEVLEIIQSCYEDDKKLLAEKRDLLEVMAQRLLEKEKIDQAEIKDILGPRPSELPIESNHRHPVVKS